MSLKTKIILMSAFFVSVILGLGIFNFVQLQAISVKVRGLATVQLPATRSMGLVDMMHDGLRAVVYQSLYLSSQYKNLSEDQMSDLNTDLNEVSTNLNKYLSQIESLDIRPETKQAINGSKTEIKAYLESARTIVNLSIKGESEKAISELSGFDQAFYDLESKLEVLGDLIEKDTEAEEQEGIKTAETAQNMGLLSIAVAALSGAAVSLLTVLNMTRAMNKILADLSESSKSLNESANTIQQSSSDLSSATVEQSASLEETTSAVEEINATLSRATEISQSSTDISLKTQQFVSEGKKLVEQMVSSIDEIGVTNQNINQEVVRSNDEMKEIIRIIRTIEDKTKVINDIVFQTKLLAFNASVEAARAGEQGKGFAVVAEEVAVLADMSGKSSKEISDLLKDSYGKVDLIIQNTQSRVGRIVGESQTKVSAGITNSKNCAQIFSEIAGRIDQVAEFANETSKASREQSLGVSQISEALRQINTATQSNVVTGEFTAKASVSIGHQAQALLSSVDELKTSILG